MDVVASRAFGGTYSNTTGKPIVVFFAGTHNTNNTGAVYINGVFQMQVNGYGAYPTGTFIVANGSTYSVVMPGESVTSWKELR